MDFFNLIFCSRCLRKKLLPPRLSQILQISVVDLVSPAIASAKCRDKFLVLHLFLFRGIGAASGTTKDIDGSRTINKYCNFRSDCWRKWRAVQYISWIWRGRFLSPGTIEEISTTPSLISLLVRDRVQRRRVLYISTPLFLL